ncbi:putative auxin-induced protein 5NG4-like [Capsicum annuum]|nr:putative auxin-induced protein 5NG4-like [Capsicum annuum]
MDPLAPSSNRVKSEIQPQPLEQEPVTPIDQSGEKTNLEDEIFNAAMENKWTKVKKLYMENEPLRTTKLTRSEDTALHLAISSYHPDRDTYLHHPHLLCIKDMITNIPKKNREHILKQKNEKGNTPLHLAAELGSVPIIECLVNSEEPELIWETNSKGETPLFITAYRGKQDAFLYLHKCCQNENEEGPIELCRRKDGDNILHAAISGEYFELAFQIIHYYKPLVNRYNTQGMSPLHILSRMPQVFRSGNRFRFLDSIIYYCTTVKELEKETYKAERKIDLYQKNNRNLPENYESLVEFLEIQRRGTKKFIVTSSSRENSLLQKCKVRLRKINPCGPAMHIAGALVHGAAPFFPKTDSLFYPDLTGVTNVNQETKPHDQGHQSDRQKDPENPPIQGVCCWHFVPKNFAHSNTNSVRYPDATGVTNENQDKKSPVEGKGNGRLFPANYAIFIEFLKCLMKIALLVLGIGLQRIKKVREKKSKHKSGVKIMKLMIEKEERYKFYKNTGEKPEDLYSRDRYKQIGAPPPAPPEIVDDTTEEDAPSNTATTKQSQTSSTDEIKSDDSNSEAMSSLIATRMTIVLNTELPTTKETPLLVASKMGIVEMVRRILKKFPIAIQDTDSEEKNILLLAVEHRQTMVYNWLIGEKYPEYVFYQVDKYGNNAVHLAAKYQNLEVWRIPGKALQLQGERKWYKYVKHTLPQSDVRYNKKGQTPRRIFEETHAKLLVEGTEWISKTAESFSVVAALIATVAFATSATIPGGADDKGKPHLENEPAFDVFSIASLVSLCFSVTALVFFLAILTSRCQHNDFEKDLPRKLLLGLTSLFASITAILVSFCAAHFFVLQDNFKNAAFPIYAATCIPVVFFAFNQFPLYVDLIRSYIQKLPLRSYKVFYTTNSSEATSSDQKKEKEDDD